jgi:hypothetical protein
VVGRRRCDGRRTEALCRPPGDETVAFALKDFHEFDGDRIARRYTFTDGEEM